MFLRVIIGGSLVSFLSICFIGSVLCLLCAGFDVFLVGFVEEWFDYVGVICMSWCVGVICFFLAFGLVLFFVFLSFFCVWDEFVWFGCGDRVYCWYPALGNFCCLGGVLLG